MIAATLAILVGIGLSRFAYSPLIPAVIDAGWFSPSQAAYLGAANLAGYLIGALVGRRVAAWTSSATALRMLMLIASLAFVASAVPYSFAWFFVWRLLSGITGGALMVLAAPTVLPHVPAARRGLASGVIFTGVGVRIIVSGTLVPSLLAHGLPTTRFALGQVGGGYACSYLFASTHENFELLFMLGASALLLALLTNLLAALCPLPQPTAAAGDALMRAALHPLTRKDS